MAITEPPKVRPCSQTCEIHSAFICELKSSMKKDQPHTQLSFFQDPMQILMISYEVKPTRGR